jgi:hypothetical protein
MELGLVARTHRGSIGAAPQRIVTGGSVVFRRLRWTGVAGSTTESLRATALGVKLISAVERQLRCDRRAAI